MRADLRTARALLLPAALLAFPALVLAGLWWWSGFWLPDFITPEAEHVIARCGVGNGEAVELTQQWAGDGYRTGIRHRFPDGSSVIAVGDGDASRALWGRVSVRTNESSVVFQLSGKRWIYYWRLRSLSSGDGATRDAR
jgi:hypothetical protein